MPNPSAPQTDRRQFLRMLAASPALPYVALSPTILHCARPGAVPGGRPRRRADRVAGGGADGLRLRGRRQGEAALRARRVPRRHRGRGDVPREPGGVHRVPAPRPAPGRHQPHRHVGVALRVERALPDPPLPVRRAERLPPGRRGGGGPRGQHPGPHHDPLERGQPADRGRRGGPRRARLVPALPRPRLEPDAGHDQARRGSRLPRAGLDHRQPGRRQAHRARARPAPRPRVSAAPATR